MLRRGQTLEIVGAKHPPDMRRYICKIRPLENGNTVEDKLAGDPFNKRDGTFFNKLELVSDQQRKLRTQ